MPQIEPPLTSALAHDNDDVLAHLRAHCADRRFQVGRATIAYQLGYTRLSQLDFAKVTLGSLHANGKKGTLLTVTPSTLGARAPAYALQLGSLPDPGPRDPGCGWRPTDRR